MTRTSVKTRTPLHASLAPKITRTVLSRLEPGDRLQSEAALARRFGVSVLTVREALSALASDGMIERRHGSGTYVTDRRQRKGVAVGTVSRGPQAANSFQNRLFLRLSDLFRREGYRCRSYVSPLGFIEGWAELTEDIEYGRIAGAAFVSMDPDSVKIPFSRNRVPVVGGLGSEHSVVLDHEDIVRQGVGHLVAQGCRRIALMQWPPVDPCYDAFRATMRECGVPVRPEWIIRSDVPETPGIGWRQFREIWSARSSEKPDGLLVTDDVLFRDVAMAILQARIDVPGQLRIVAHANKGSGLTYPFPVSFLEVDVDEWAETIVKQLIALMNGKSAGPADCKIRARLVTEDQTASPRYSSVGAAVSV